MSLIPKIEEDVANILHPIDALVDNEVAAAKAAAKADYEAEKTKLAADVKAAIARAKAAAIAATPTVEAAATAAFDVALKAVEDALAAYGVLGRPATRRAV